MLAHFLVVVTDKFHDNRCGIPASFRRVTAVCRSEWNERSPLLRRRPCSLSLVLRCDSFFRRPACASRSANWLERWPVFPCFSTIEKARGCSGVLGESAAGSDPMCAAKGPSKGTMIGLPVFLAMNRNSLAGRSRFSRSARRRQTGALRCRARKESCFSIRHLLRREPSGVLPRRRDAATASLRAERQSLRPLPDYQQSVRRALRRGKASSPP